MSLPTLILTSYIKESEKPGTFIGRINEISGIFAQGGSREAVYDDLVRNTAIMLPFKQPEVLAALNRQMGTGEVVLSSKANVPFEVRELEAA